MINAMRKITNKISKDIEYGAYRIAERKNKNRIITNIFDYNNILRHRPDLDRKVNLYNRFYGYSYTLKKYSGYKGVINAAMEHAPGLDIVDAIEYKDKTLPALIVNSKQRQQFLRKYVDKPIFAIGPSIHYAESVYREYDIKIIKKQLGKTLLIYPLHDIEDFSYIQDAERFVDYVKQVKERYEYDSVIVSMYFVDIERGRHLLFEKQGWHIVSSGRRENYDFNNCMKTIIQLADHAIFQAYASAIGYCIYENVPITIFHQPFRFIENGVDEIQTNMGINDVTMKSFEEMFGDYSNVISKEQYEFCKYWYGYDSIWKSQELALLFKYIEKLKVNMSKEKMIHIANKKEFFPIKDLLLQAIADKNIV